MDFAIVLDMQHESSATGDGTVKQLARMAKLAARAAILITLVIHGAMRRWAKIIGQVRRN
jgi:hypothetical protein